MGVCKVNMGEVEHGRGKYIERGRDIRERDIGRGRDIRRGRDIVRGKDKWRRATMGHQIISPKGHLNTIVCVS